MSNNGYIFEVKTVQTNVIKTLFEALKEILTECNIDMMAGNSEDNDENKRGYIKMIAMDPTQTIFVHLKLEGKYFENYFCKGQLSFLILLLNQDLTQ